MRTKTLIRVNSARTRLVLLTTTFNQHIKQVIHLLAGYSRTLQRNNRTLHV